MTNAGGRKPSRFSRFGGFTMYVIILRVTRFEEQVYGPFTTLWDARHYATAQGWTPINQIQSYCKYYHIKKLRAP